MSNEFNCSVLTFGMMCEDVLNSYSNLKASKFILTTALIALLISICIVPVMADDGATPWTEKNYLPTKYGEYYLENDITITSTWYVPSGYTTIDLRGHNITLSGSGSVIDVGGGDDLTITDTLALTDPSVAEGKITGGNNEAGGGVLVGGGGFFTLAGGNITGNTATKYGGGGVAISSSTFTMTGGNITGNTAKIIGDAPKPDYDASGGGVCIIDQGSFTMTGGNIWGNTAEENGCGGVSVIGHGIFMLSGNAKIEDNMAGDVPSNVRMPSGNTIKLDNLTDGAHIGVTVDVGKDNSVHFAERLDEMEVTADDATYFFADAGEPYSVQVNIHRTYLDLANTAGIRPWDEKKVLPSNPGMYCLKNNIDLASSWNAPAGDITIDLNGFTIKLAKEYESSVICLYQNANLTITDSSGGEGVITGGYVVGYGAGVYVDGGKFTLTGGNIKGNTAWVYGGGVYVKSGGTFIMTGGKITENEAYLDGGGVYVNGDSRFIMIGGNIMNNTAQDGSGVYAGGRDSFTMSGDSTVNANNDVYLALSNNVIHISGLEFSGSALKITGYNITIGDTIVSVDSNISARDIVKRFKLYDENFVLKADEKNNTLVVADAKVLKPVIPEIEKEGELILVPVTAPNATIYKNGNNVTITDNVSGVVLEIEFDEILDRDDKYKGVPENIVAYYPESPMIPSENIADIDGKPGNAKYSLNLTLENVTTLLPTINATVNTTVKEEFAKEGKELMTMFTAESNTEEINNNLSKLEVVMIFKKSWYDTMNKGVCWYHRADNGTILDYKQIGLTDVQPFTGDDGETYYRVTITVDKPPFFSDYGLYGMRGSDNKSIPSSGGNSGSSTWATVTPTVTPTSTGSETDTPTSTPTDKVSETVPTGTQPTGTKTPMPMLGVLAGLSLAGLILRRK